MKGTLVDLLIVVRRRFVESLVVLGALLEECMRTMLRTEDLCAVYDGII